MARGISLHVGLNRIDPGHYGTDGRLAGAENDATAMQRLAASLGYQTSVLLTAAARADAVLAEIRDAAAQLVAGDTFLITYAGHGAQIPDDNDDEGDQKDETWCVYDRMISDDELYASWGHFRAGVLVVTVSDSCHSGTVNRVTAREAGDVAEAVVYRYLPFGIATLMAYDNHRPLYDSVRRATRELLVRASVVSLAAAQDDQLAADGASNGLFTEKLLQAWNQGRFRGDYATLMDAVRRQMPHPSVQTPGYAISGALSDALSRQPFAITGAANPGVAPPEKAPTACTTTPKPTEEDAMQNIDTTTQFMDNGNWEEVAALLSEQLPSQRGGADFMATVVAANARAAQEALSGAATIPNVGLVANRGGSVFRAFWWGFHVQISPIDLTSILNLVNPNGEIVKFLRIVVPKDYQYWIAILTPFVAITSSVLRGLDRGRGVYISMSWFAPGVFVPTSV